MSSPLLRKHGITDKKSWYKWALKNHPDKGGDSENFALVKNDYEKYIRDGAGKGGFPAGGSKSGFDGARSPFTSENPFPPGTVNWRRFEKLLSEMRTSSQSTQGNTGQPFTQSDGFSYNYAKSYASAAKNPFVWEGPRRSKRKACYGQETGTRIWCDKPVEPGEKFCKKCKKEKCNHLVKDTLNKCKKQCSRNKRPDDDYCDLHSKKPSRKKVEQPSVQCSHIKKNGGRCNNKSKNEYCHLHQKFHVSTSSEAPSQRKEKKDSD
jgi:hypothetical protein